MLYCEICDQHIEEGHDDIITHVFTWHKEVLSEWAEEHIFEWDESDPREEALTVGERNPTLR